MPASNSPLALFPHGLSAGSKLLIYLLLSIAMITADTEFHALHRFRSAMNVLLFPVQTFVQTPWLTYNRITGFFVKQAQLQRENSALRQSFIQYSLAMQRYRMLAQENERLRVLLGMQQRSPLSTELAEILSVPRDPYQRQVTINRGSRAGLQSGEAVIDEAGLLGQLTQLSPYSSEVTLLTNKDQSVPVLLPRTGLRTIVFGTGLDGLMEIRYLPHNADVRAGDLLVTSGLDGVYPAGLAVAKVVQIDPGGSGAFANILCKPVAAVDRNRQVLVVTGMRPNTTGKR